MGKEALRLRVKKVELESGTVGDPAPGLVPFTRRTMDREGSILPSRLWKTAWKDAAEEGLARR